MIINSISVIINNIDKNSHENSHQTAESFSNSRIATLANNGFSYLKSCFSKIPENLTKNTFYCGSEPKIEHLNLDQPLSSLTNKENETKEIISSLLKSAGYVIKNDQYKLTYRMRLIVAAVETEQGKKFVKLHNKTYGKQEFDGCLFVQKHLPIIKSESLIESQNFELVVQPFVEGIDTDKGMLFDVIGKLEKQGSVAEKQKYWDLFDKIFKGMYQTSASTMKFEVTNGSNDRLFFDRLKTQKSDNQSGTIETFYTNAQINMNGKIYQWNDFLDKKWMVDGEEYNETLRELLDQAKVNLNPENRRLMSISQGDWHEMNIFTDILDEKVKKPTFAYLDFEMAGRNSLIGDAMVFLYYLSIYADYIGPKYYPEQFSKSPTAVSLIQDQYGLKEVHPLVQENGHGISISGISQFGTSSVRKEIAKRFMQNYLNPIIMLAVEKYGSSCEKQIEQAIKSSLLLRFLGPCNLCKMDSMDQSKLFTLLIKCIGTKKGESQNSTLVHFIEEL